MKKEKKGILQRIVIGFVFGIMLCLLIYLLLAMYFKKDETVHNTGNKNQEEVIDEEYTSEQDDKESTTEEDTANVSTAKEMVIDGSDTKIVAMQTNGEEVVVTDPNATDNTKLTLMQNGIRYFKLVYPAGTDEELELLQNINSSIEELTGYQLPSSSDAESKGTYEVLIGETNREESQTVKSQLGNSGYAIKIVNKKIVIVGSSSYCTRKAMTKFIDFLKAGKLGDVSRGALKVNNTFSYAYNLSGSLQETVAASEVLYAETSVVLNVELPSELSGWQEQGGCTDGTYYYQAYIKRDDTSNQENNQCRILKYDMSGNLVRQSEILSLNHANDITYNNKLGCLVICHNVPNNNRLSYMNPDTLEIVGSVDMEYKIYSIDYNAATDRYVVGISGGQTFRILDSNFNTLSEAYQPTSQTKGYTTQGVAVDDDFIYFVLHNKNVVVVYDWDGEFVSLIHLDIAANIEPEHISIVNNTLYIGCSAGTKTTLYKIDTLN